MKKLVIILALLLCGASFANNNNALGVWVGRYHAGMDIKHLSGNNNAWDIYIGAFSIGEGETEFPFDFGYYWLFNIIKADASVGRFPLHIGPDLGLKFESAGFGSWLNIAGGISWILPTSLKMDISFDPAFPIVSLTNYDKFRIRVMKDSWPNWRFLFHVYFF
ncbi:MAG: hypothetical protein LBH25_08890 [Fibromonadaceae bacterium]|jgi:hypothetical protein|nr:hypothetical protein [Fibromonadaceae bacterium]